MKKTWEDIEFIDGLVGKDENLELLNKRENTSYICTVPVSHVWLYPWILQLVLSTFNTPLHQQLCLPEAGALSVLILQQELSRGDCPCPSPSWLVLGD